ncbi:MAG: hypothetical protein ACRDID_04495, partial [Ktedonobacterales bacterium]
MDDDDHGAQPDTANQPEDEADSYTLRQAALRALAQSQCQQQQEALAATPTASAQASATHPPAVSSSATGRSAAPRGSRRGAIFGA